MESMEAQSQKRSYDMSKWKLAPALQSASDHFAVVVSKLMPSTWIMLIEARTLQEVTMHESSKCCAT